MNVAVPNATSSADRDDPAALFEFVRDEFEAIDLNDPLPKSVRVGIAVGKSNGDGVEPTEDVIRLLVLADRELISSEEYTSLVLFLLRR